MKEIGLGKPFVQQSATVVNISGVTLDRLVKVRILRRQLPVFPVVGMTAGARSSSQTLMSEGLVSRIAGAFSI